MFEEETPVPAPTHKYLKLCGYSVSGFFSSSDLSLSAEIHCSDSAVYLQFSAKLVDFARLSSIVSARAPQGSPFLLGLKTLLCDLMINVVIGRRPTVKPIEKKGAD
jgi:hypothetical protein